MSKSLPLAVRIALAREKQIPHDVAEILEDEMKHEYAGTIRSALNLSERIDDALAFLSFESTEMECEAWWQNQPSVYGGY